MQKSILVIISLIVGSMGLTGNAFAADMAGDDCQCPKLSCDAACEMQTDLTFYSEKCGDGEKVKSCSRPTCVPIDDAPVSCRTAKMGAVKAVEAKREPASAEPAPAVAPKVEPREIGRVKFVEPEAWLKTDAGKATLAVGQGIHEKDHIITSDKGRVQIDFTNGNKLNITSSTEIVITEASDIEPTFEKKRMILDLMKGRVRNKVNVKYDGEQSFYQVRTPTAVAGVRGTEFVASVYDDDKGEMSKIETLEGRVELSDRAHKAKVFVAKNETASYVVERKQLAMNDGTHDVNGTLTPVAKMSDDQVLDLNRVTAFETPANAPEKVAKAKKVVVEDEPICATPAANLNDCAWTCENNPQGEKKCHTELPHVSCVRRICNANGQWSSPTRLPASYHESCRGDVPVVKSCDY